MRYTVENVTGRPQDVSFDDGTGAAGHQDRAGPHPDGRLADHRRCRRPSPTSPPQQANIAGDGHGGTKLSFTMTLFPPIGSDDRGLRLHRRHQRRAGPAARSRRSRSARWRARPSRAVPTSYKGGADTGVRAHRRCRRDRRQPAQAARRRRPLLAGLIKLRDGAGQLNAGLAGEAVPGPRSSPLGPATRPPVPTSWRPAPRSLPGRPRTRCRP